MSSISKVLSGSDRRITWRPYCFVEPAVKTFFEVFSSSSKEMDNVKKGYETRIQQDLLTDAILGKNRTKLYQQLFQVSLI